jgi:cytochrome b pre-mRNA-processing protein 3
MRPAAKEMILPLFGKPRPAVPVEAVYNAIVAQSRHPRFYAKWGVPDTVTGRFDMISLHMGLVLRRLRGHGRRTDKFAQDLFDLFFLDMDRSLREMGVGDTTVPKRVEKMGSLFYGMLGKLTEALDAGESETLRAAIARNIYEGGKHDGATRLAAYVEERALELAAHDVGLILNGKLPPQGSE